MSLSSTTCRNRLLALLNASQATFGTNVDTKRWTTGELDAAVLGSWLRIADAICQNRWHPDAVGFLTNLTPIVSGGNLMARKGPVHSVNFAMTGGIYASTTVPATEWPETAMDEFRLEILNPQALSRIEPHFILRGDKLFHNGAGLAKVSGVTAVVSADFPTYTSSPSIPDQYEDLSVIIAAADVRGKEGAHVEAQNAFAQQAELGLKTIRSYGASSAVA